jgi:hypothetical protein
MPGPSRPGQPKGVHQEAYHAAGVPIESEEGAGRVEPRPFPLPVNDKILPDKLRYPSTQSTMPEQISDDNILSPIPPQHGLVLKIQMT